MLSLLSAWMLTACGSMGLDGPDTAAPSGQDETVQAANYDSIGDVPEYSGEPYVEINDNRNLKSRNWSRSPMKSTAGWMIWDGAEKRRHVSGKISCLLRRESRSAR